MAKKIEEFHLVNTESYERIVSFCRSLGRRYKPNIPDITLEQLELQWSELSSVSMQIDETRRLLHADLYQREILYQYLQEVADSLHTSAHAQLSGTSAPGMLVKLARKKVVHKSSVPKIILDENDFLREAKTISVSQSNYDSRLAQFKRLINSLEKREDATTFLLEDILLLRDLCTEIEESNSKVHAVQNLLYNLLDKRHEILYTPIRGMVDRARTVLKYLEGALGAESRQLKRLVAQLQLRRI